MLKQRSISLSRLTIWLASAVAYAFWMVFAHAQRELPSDVLAATRDVFLLFCLVDGVTWAWERLVRRNTAATWHRAFQRTLIGVLMWLVVLVLVGVLALGTHVAGMQR